MNLSIEAGRFLPSLEQSKKAIKHWAVPLLSLTALALITAACTPQDAQNIAVARITKPQDGEVVKHRDIVEGTVENLPRNWRVWVTVTDINDNVLHPQEEPAAFVGTDGKGWRRLNVRFGNNNPPQLGEDIDHRISVLLANPQGNRELERYMDRCHRQRECPGYEPSRLPSGVFWQEHMITVHRENPGLSR